MTGLKNFDNNRLVDHFQDCDLFCDLQYGFRYSQSTVDLLTVVFDRITWVFNRSWAIRAVTPDISKGFDRLCHAGLFHKLKLYEISGQIFGFISSFFSNRRPQVVLDGKSSQEYPDNSGIPQVSILDPTLFLISSSLMTFRIILSVIFNMYYWCENRWSVVEEISSFKMLGLSLSSGLDWGSYIISIAKSAPNKIGTLIRSLNFLSEEVALYLCKCTIQPCMKFCVYVRDCVPSC